MRLIGPILLGVGFTFLVAAVVACIRLMSPSQDNLPQTAATNAVSQLTFSVENINNLYRAANSPDLSGDLPEI